MLERLRRPDSYSRHLPPLSHTRTSEYNSTSHGRTRSYVYERAGAPVYPESSSESPSPREARPSLPLQQQATASTMQSTSISFATTISATSTWAMSPSVYSPSSTSSSSPVSRVRTQHRAIDSERGGAVPRKDRGPFEAAQRRPLPIPSRPAPAAQVIHTHPRASISPDRSRAASPAGRLHAASPFTAERHAYRERQDSWSPESARQPLPTMWNPQPSRGTSPEFVQGSSRASRRWAPPPPPSPSPSTSSYSASGRTDTDPTDEDEQQHQVKIEQEQEQDREGVKLPSFRSAFPSAPAMWHSHSQHSPFSWDGASLRRDALGPLSSRSAAGSPSPSSAEYASAGAVWGPRSALFRPDGEGDTVPVLVSDVRSSISHARNETVNANANARQHTQWRVQQGPVPPPTPTRTRPAPLANMPLVGTALAELPVMSPTPKKYRFVTSKPAEMHAEEVLDARRRPVTVSPSGTKRRYPGASSESSIDIPLTPPETPEDEDESAAPRKRRQAQGQLPFENSFPAESGAAGGRSPRGAIVPAYHYDTERALKCAFPGCGAVLTGKKSETASHMRSHFLQAVGETLECPWPADTNGEDGSGSGSGGRGCCGMAFKDSANFGRHVSSKHIRAEEYQCNRCGRPFARRDAALRHMKTLCRMDGTGTRRKNEKKVKARTEEYERVSIHLNWVLVGCRSSC
ncbi:hypothetical protein LXA43DRAFT_875832 [Ganoderma leucocontextum]|nr:hypothetical protein LXA43DRAFT_875832 [Ganoderma leucocontextum]